MKEQFKLCEEKMNKTMESLSREYNSLRAGRANPSVLDKITIDYYGAPTSLNQIAAISVSEARVLVIQPWDKSCLGLIEKAIQTSDIGINPNNDGNVIRIVFPSLTEERRRELSKQVSKSAEEAKVSIRSIRRDIIETLKKMKKNNEITEDDLKGGEEDIQDITDKFCKKIDSMSKDKEKEIMSI